MPLQIVTSVSKCGSRSQPRSGKHSTKHFELKFGQRHGRKENVNATKNEMCHVLEQQEEQEPTNRRSEVVGMSDVMATRIEIDNRRLQHRRPRRQILTRQY
jgi:hypothetical protein